MFDDFEEESPDVTPDSPDRAIVWAIHSRGGDSGVTHEEAWAILHERYPDDPRFLLLNTYAELSESRKTLGPSTESVWTPAYFLKKVDRVLSGSSTADTPADTLHPHVRDLVMFGGAVLASAKGDDAKALTDLRAKIGAEGEAEPKRDDRDRAGLKLRRYEREVVKELHDRTQDNKPLGTRAPPPEPRDDWGSAVADKEKPRRKYAADGRFERGELIEHPKFGVGVVTGLETGKVVILFESGSKKLMAGAG